MIGEFVVGDDARQVNRLESAAENVVQRAIAVAPRRMRPPRGSGQIRERIREVRLLQKPEQPLVLELLAPTIRVHVPRDHHGTERTPLFPPLLLDQLGDRMRALRAVQRGGLLRGRAVVRLEVHRVHVRGRRRIHDHRGERIAARRRLLPGDLPLAPVRLGDRQRRRDHVLLLVEAVAPPVAGDHGDAQVLASDLRDKVGGGPRPADLIEAEDDVVRPRGIDRPEPAGEHLRRGRDRRRLDVGMRAVLGASGREPVPVPRPDHNGGYK